MPGPSTAAVDFTLTMGPIAPPPSNSSDIHSFPLLLFENPANNLVPVENDLPRPAHPEMWQTGRQTTLPQRPDGAADELRHLGNCERFSQ
jgi:hypothetical protein